jgi:hypothetical protein
MTKKKKKDDDLNPDELREHLSEQEAALDPPDRTGDDEGLDEGEDPNFAPYHFPPGHKEGDSLDPGAIDPPEDTGNEEALNLNEEPTGVPFNSIVEVLTDENDQGQFAGRRRRVIRREARVLSMEERLAIDDEIVASNGEMRRFEVEKAAAVKKYNGEIAEQRQILDDAIQILRKDCVEFDVERIQKIDEERWIYTFHDIETDAIIDEVDIPENERQTEFKF